MTVTYVHVSASRDGLFDLKSSADAEVIDELCKKSDAIVIGKRTSTFARVSALDCSMSYAPLAADSSR